jgi:outer membrane protease
MKNIAVFTALVIILWALPCPQARGQGHILSTLPAAGAGFPYGLSLSSSLGLLAGYGEEIVYKYPGRETHMSQLLWDIKPLVYYGAALDFSRKTPPERLAFFSGLSLKFGFPGKTGIMEDRDWLTADDQLSNYSQSDNYTNQALLLDFSLGLSFPLRSFGFLKAYWALSWMNFQWTGRDGYLQYPKGPNGNYLYGEVPLDDSVEKDPQYGVSIMYSQNWLLVSPGLALSVPLLNWLALDVSFLISPLVFCVARDDHVLNKAEYEDRVTGGLYLEPRGDLMFFFRERCELSLYVSYRFIRGDRGESWGRTGTGDGQFYPIGKASGAAWYAVDSGLSFKVRL